MAYINGLEVLVVLTTYIHWDDPWSDVNFQISPTMRQTRTCDRGAAFLPRAVKAASAAAVKEAPVAAGATRVPRTQRPVVWNAFSH